MIEAQLAVQRHRAGLQGSDGDDSRSSPIARGKKTPPPSPARDRPEAQASKASAAGEKERTKNNSSSSPRTQPSPENMTVAGGDVRAGEEEGNADLEMDGGVGNPGGTEDSRRTEEAEALGSQLQIIAMHLVRGDVGWTQAPRGQKKEGFCAQSCCRCCCCDHDGFIAEKSFQSCLGVRGQ